MPVYVEIWDGNRWRVRDVGSCMPADFSAITSAPGTTANYHQLDEDGFDESSDLDSGKYYLALNPDTAACPEGEECTDTLEWSLASGVAGGAMPEQYDWLRDYWERDPAPDELQNPRATATFGVYRGNDRIIYWREVP